MAVVVFDSDVLIGFLSADDNHHVAAVEEMRRAYQPGIRRWVCSVNYAEILVGPLATGQGDVVDRMLVGLGIETMQVDMALARSAAEVRVKTGLKLPDAFALATAVHAEARGFGDVHLASFDRRVVAARNAMKSDPGA